MVYSKMRAVVQRVKRASVTIDNNIFSQIGQGLLVLLGIARDDSNKDADYLLNKIRALRVFDDATGRMNICIDETQGEIMIISQFTLYGDVRRGTRPSWSEAASPELAEPIYNYFVQQSASLISVTRTGKFRCPMEVELINDGPVTILMDSRKLF